MVKGLTTIKIYTILKQQLAASRSLRSLTTIKIYTILKQYTTKRIKALKFDYHQNLHHSQTAISVNLSTDTV